MTSPTPDPYNQQPVGSPQPGAGSQSPYPQPAYGEQSAYPQQGYGQPAYAQPGPGGFDVPPELAPADVGFGEAFKRYLKRYAQFKGAASRSEYWWTQLALALIYLIPTIIIIIGVAAAASTVELDPVTGEVTGAAPDGGLGVVAIGYALYGILYLAFIIPSLALLVRRLHDSGKPGLLALLLLVPGVGGVILLVLALMPTDRAAWQREWFV
ncbi:MAG: DUF805 domain-containing protein [Actinomyces sp.]|uniref:DUF805 domain-containing protein n=1 Tax=Actinomyces sp. TaxID=29317 RepID=UPI0026DA7263|nr:DUF805 domain-containing protein [Actinomyces sp.]MDO4243964.1 DUF805 domain-containing protein [Actinomyces sp.]